MERRRCALVGGYVLLLLASERQARLGEREGGRAPGKQLLAAGGAREGALKQNQARLPACNKKVAQTAAARTHEPRSTQLGERVAPSRG
jgi:hypothetical protein